MSELHGYLKVLSTPYVVSIKQHQFQT